LLSTSTFSLRKKTFRGLQNSDPDTARQQQIKIHIDTAITAFDKALGLAPEKPQAYYHLISAHLLAGNFSLANGVLVDKYLKKFEQSPQAALLAALTKALEGNSEEALKQLYGIVEYVTSDVLLSTEERRLLLYTTYYNLAILNSMAGDKDQAVADWINLKDWANAQRDGLLFTLAVRHLTERSAAVLPRSPSLSTVLGVKAGDDASTLKQRYETVHGFSLWLEGEKLLLLQYPEGKRLVIDENERVKSAWQVLPISVESQQTVFDRFIKRHGIPTRYIPTDGCDYLAYDELGVGFCFTEGAIFSKFIYMANKE